MSIRNFIVIVLAGLAAACEFVTIVAAGREVNSLRERGRRLRSPREAFGVRYNLADTVGGVNSLDLSAALESLRDQWQPGNLAVWAVKIVAPIGIACGLAAVVVSAT